MSEPIRVMLGGSAANFAVHATNLNKAKPPITATTTRDAQTTAVTGALAAAAVEDEAATTQTMGDGVARGGVSSQLHQQRCVLHTSVASDDMGEFVRRKLDEYGVEWSQAKEREHQVRLTMRGWIGMELVGFGYGSFRRSLRSPRRLPDFLSTIRCDGQHGRHCSRCIKLRSTLRSSFVLLQLRMAFRLFVSPVHFFFLRRRSSFSFISCPFFCHLAQLFFTNERSTHGHTTVEDVGRRQESEGLESEKQHKRYPNVMAMK